MATSAQWRDVSDMDRVKRWNVAEAMGVAWMECLQPVDTKSVYGKDFNALSYNFIAVLVTSFALARNIQRSLFSYLQRSSCLAQTHPSFDRKGLSFWAIWGTIMQSSMCMFFGSTLGSSSRMSCCLMRRNYGVSDNFGAAADYDDHTNVKEIEKMLSSLGALLSLLVPFDPGDIRFANDRYLVEGSSAVSPGFVGSEFDERIVLELPSSMVQPLRVIHGAFQAVYVHDIRCGDHITGYCW
ncbi:hypothetical protein PanWU01x14_327460 [Parasponia andersonii]|uniref:Uncharacterized protein n=1 Tax=Parasponia andersonii TaxID=3476 RepID=A0A2P5AJ25_PARAD|nr:hypothetical protein PanWU01x14_327460 [Parasponia andersonii]